MAHKAEHWGGGDSSCAYFNVYGQLPFNFIRNLSALVSLYNQAVIAKVCTWSRSWGLRTAPSSVTSCGQCTTAS
eukprot:6481041-Amphidinium_carterae.1